MTSYMNVQVGEIAKVVGGGTPRTAVNEYWNGNVPWLTPKDLSENPSRHTSHGSRYITETGLNNSSARLLPTGSVLLSSRAPIGLVSIAAQPIATNQGFKSLILNENHDSEYWYYLLKNSTEYLRSVANGSTFQEISGAVVKSLRFLVPPLAEQRRIAGVLGALDDLIERNESLSKASFELAETLFALRFGTSFSGEVAFTDLVEVLGGGTPKTSVAEYWNGDVPWFSVVDTPNYGQPWVFTTEKKISDQGIKNSSAKVYASNTTVLTARGTVGNVALTAVPMAFNQSCYGLRCKLGGDGFFTYFATRAVVDRLRRNAHGSVFSTITRKTLDSIWVPNVSDRDVRAFDTAVGPLLQSCRSLGSENASLKKVRDELLPLLISGKIRVQDAGEVMEELVKGV